MDILWLKDKSLENGEDLLPPNELAQEIADDLQAARRAVCGDSGEGEGVIFLSMSAPCLRSLHYLAFLQKNG